MSVSARLHLFCVAIAHACAAPTASAPATPESLRMYQESVRAAVAQVAPSVVTVETVGGRGLAPACPARPLARDASLASQHGPPRREGIQAKRCLTPYLLPPPDGGIPGLSESGGRFRIGAGPTTGLVFRGDGLILTSTFTFARDPAVITVTLADGRQFAATLVARDEIRRLALLKIEATDLPVPTWVDDEDEIRVGQSAIAVGRSFGSDRAGVSLGVVSGLRRMGGNVVQTDARLSPANYGGPLIDLQGRVVGFIVPMSYSAGELAGIELYDSGIGFAVPGWRATPAAQRLARGEKIVRGVLGVRIGPGAAEGLSIVDVIAGAPAQAAGIQAGDELTAIDDAPVRDPAELARRMAFRAAGEAVALTVRRGGRLLHLDAVLADPANLGSGARPEEAESPPP